MYQDLWIHLLRPTDSSLGLRPMEPSFKAYGPIFNIKAHIDPSFKAHGPIFIKGLCLLEYLKFEAMFVHLRCGGIVILSLLVFFGSLRFYYPHCW